MRYTINAHQDPARTVIEYLNMVRDALECAWPIFGLRIDTPRLQLQYPDDIDLLKLGDIIKRFGIHPPGFVPMGSWTLLTPQEIRGELLRWHWKCRTDWRPDTWRLELAAIDVQNRRLPRHIGVQSVFAHDFQQLRSANTGSWLVQDVHGQGYGTEMRQAMLSFAFECLGATRALSDYWHDNHASRRVSEKCGYRVTGQCREPRPTDANGGTRQDLKIYAEVTPDTWHRPEFPVTVHGFEPCRALFGLE